MKITGLNHVAVVVSDVSRSSRFYGKLIGLDPVPRPAFPFPGAWFRIGSDQELHLIGEDDASAPRARAGGEHFALRVDDVDSAAATLKERRVAIQGPIVRPDGARQIFVEDPDGNRIEFCCNLP